MHFRSVVRDAAVSTYPVQPYAPGMVAGYGAPAFWQKRWFGPSVVLVLAAGMAAVALWPSKK